MFEIASKGTDRRVGYFILVETAIMAVFEFCGIDRCDKDATAIFLNTDRVAVIGRDYHP